MALLTNIQHYYSFDGSASTDLVGSNNGTDTSITYNSGNGKINVGAGFGGASRIHLTSDAGTKPTGNFTISGWFKTTNAAQQSLVTAFSDGATSPGADFRGYEINMNSLGKVELTAYATGVNIFDIFSTNTYKDGSFHMLVARWDGTTYSIRVDDSDSATFSSSTAINYRTNCPSDIGAVTEVENGTGYLNFFNGALDEIGYWSQSLSSADATQLYNGGAGLQYPFTGATVFAAKQLSSLGAG